MATCDKIDDFIITPGLFLAHQGEFVRIDMNALSQNIKIEDHYMICGKDKELIVSTNEIEKEIASINYAGTKAPRERRVEENNRFPAFVGTFYHLIFLLLKLHQKSESCPIVPSPELFVYFYFMFNQESLLSAPNNFVIFDDEYYDKRFLKGRLIRSYPSLVRDFHFALMFDEFLKQTDRVNAKIKSSAKYDMNKDTNGTDIVCQIKGKEYRLGLCVDSVRAKERVKQKKSRLLDEGKWYGIPDVYFALKLPGNSGNTINLYPHKALEKIKKILINHDYEDRTVKVIE